MELHYLRPGHKIKMRDGAEAEVLSETEDGEWIRIRYLGGADEPLFAGTEDLAHKNEIEALLGAVVGGSWGDRVMVIVHYRPEDQDFGGGYEATTLTGVPHNVIVTGGDEDSAEGALNQLLDGLKAFGFRGRVAVQDATGLGRPERYELDC